jgi:hypothetical protein
VNKFARERYFVEQLLGMLRLPMSTDLRDPLVDYGCETALDVIALLNGRRIGFQVTEYDGGEGFPAIGSGQMRAKEMGLIREAGAMGVYAGFGSPHFKESFRARIASKVAKSLRYTFTDFDEVCLLVSANVPGAGLSTLFHPDI